MAIEAALSNEHRHKPAAGPKRKVSRDKRITSEGKLCVGQGQQRVVQRRTSLELLDHMVEIQKQEEMLMTTSQFTTASQDFTESMGSFHRTLTPSRRSSYAWQNLRRIVQCQR